MTKDMMVGDICIIDSRKIRMIVGSGAADTVALSRIRGFVRLFSGIAASVLTRKKGAGDPDPD